MEDKKGDSLMVIKLQNQKVPEFKQVKGKDWIYWGEKNDYPDYLIELYMRSSTHNAIITGKVNYVLGNGWFANKTGLPLTEQAILNKFISKINEEESLDELSEKVDLDFELFNAISLEVIWNKAKTDFDLHHIPYNKLRTNEDESKYYYSKDWTQSKQSEEKTGLKEYDPFDFKEKKNGIFIYKITAPRKGKDPNVYAMPEYIGSTQAIETDVECANYNLSEIKTGFSGGTIINFFNGIPSKDEQRELRKEIVSKLTGTDKAGSLILNWADGRERGSEIQSLNGNDLDKRYVELKKDVRQEIFTGHKVSSPMLFGVKTEGQLGGRAEIAEAYELFQNTYISKRQRILEKIFNKFAALKGLRANLQIKPTSAINTNVFSESTIIQFLPAKAIQEVIAERMGIDLAKYEGQPVVSTSQEKTTMSEQVALTEKILEKFSVIGRPRSAFNVYKSKCLFHADSFSVEREEKEYFKRKRDLTGVEKSIIDLLNKDNYMPPAEIAKALKTDVATVKENIRGLIADDLIVKTDTVINDEEISVLEPSADAIDVIDNDGAKTTNIEVLYSYEERPNAPKLIGESRNFCKRMMELDRLYTRQEINSMSNEFGTDVWTFKGGWYTNPNTDAPTPQCRHIWKQNVVKAK